MKCAVALVALPLMFAQESAVVEGVAFDKLTGAGVPGVAITLRSPTIKGFFRGKTDSQGMFRIAGLEPGEYRASVLEIDGYAGPKEWDPSRQLFRAEPGRTVRSLRIPLTPLGSIEGRVLDEQRRPIPKIEVEFEAVSSSSGHYYATDEEGRFRIPDIEPGAYRLRASPALPEAAHASEYRRHWVPTYYPNGTELSAAQTIYIREGSRLEGFDIRMQNAPRFRVRGIVLDDVGQPVPGAEIVQWPELGHGRIENRFRAAKDGTFDIPEIRSGNWRLFVSSKAGDITLRGMLELTVPKRDLTDVTIRLARPFPLDVDLTGLPAEETPTAAVAVSLRPLSGFGADVSVNGMKMPARIPVVYPGTYRIGVAGLVNGHYVASVLIGGEDVTGRDVPIVGSQPVRVVFQRGAAQVTGTVAKGAGAFVVLVEGDEQRAFPMQSLRRTACDADGKFAIDGLRPGTWLALAFDGEPVDDAAVYEAVFRGGLRNDARTVRLAERESATVDLKPIPWPY